MSHTPGPWNIAPLTSPYIADSNDPKIKEWLVTTGAERFDALSVGTSKSQIAIIPLDDSSMDNARLIAAAPDMIAALRKAHRMLTRDYIDDAKIAVIDQVNEAIDKATGKPCF